MNPKFTVQDIDDSEITRRIMNVSKVEPGGRWKVIAGVGAVAGLIKANADDTDDNPLSGTAKMAGGAGVALGVDWGLNQIFTASDVSKADVEGTESRVRLVRDKPEPAPETRKRISITTGDLGKEMPKIQHELSEEELRRVKKIKSWARNGKTAGLIGLGAFAVATAMDVGQDFSDKQQTGEMKAQEERNLTQKMNRQRKDKAKNAYGHVDMGQMAIDMFNDRIGHHLMGNAKANMPTYNTSF
jgi:hypothetical protein